MAVLDASALLAYLQHEPGADAVENVLGQAVISTVNWVEVVQKAVPSASEAADLRRGLQALGLEFLPLSVNQAEIAGRLRQTTDKFGLSLGDRACLAVGIERDDTVYTADDIWRKLRLSVAVKLIR